jgi:hypothetical protein
MTGVECIKVKPTKVHINFTYGDYHLRALVSIEVVNSAYISYIILKNLSHRCQYLCLATKYKTTDIFRIFLSLT